MREFPIEELVERVGSAYTVVVAAAKRAKQIKEGAPPLVQVESRNPLTIALHEIALGLVEITEPIPPSEEPEVAVEAEVETEATPALPDLPLVDLADELGEEVFDEDLEDEEEEEDEDEDLDTDLDLELDDDLEDDEEESDWDEDDSDE